MSEIIFITELRSCSMIMPIINIIEKIRYLKTLLKYFGPIWNKKVSITSIIIGLDDQGLS